MTLRRRAPSATDAALAPDRVAIAGYHVTALVGVGRLGPVYRAVQQPLRREVALRLLRPDGAAARRTAAERFLRQALAAREVRHENVVAALDAGEDTIGCWQALEPYEGRRLAELVTQRAPLTAKRALRVALDCARGLEAVHRAGLAHLDLRPGNVVVAADGSAKIADIGLAPPILLAEPAAAPRWRLSDLPYVAPEVAAAAPQADPRADIYALGALLVEMLAGAPPAPARGAACVDLRVLEGLADASLVAVARTALAPAPEDRYATSGELREDLERLFYDFSPIHARRATASEAPAPEIDVAPAPVSRPPKGAIAWAVAGIAFLIAAAATAALLRRPHAPDERVTTPATTAAPAQDPPRRAGDEAAAITLRPAAVVAAPSATPAAATAEPAVASTADAQPAAAPIAVQPAAPPLSIAAPATDAVAVPAWVVADGVDAAGRWREFSVAGFHQRVRWCPPGSFWLGSPADEDGRRADERRVLTTLTHGFWIADSETTQELWRAVMGDDPSRFHGRSLPVDSVSWTQADAFARALSARIGARVRLPTEAEWEYACRAGSTAAFATAPERVCWSTENAAGATQPVRRLAANAWGLYDMQGNVLEWCADAYGAYPDGEAVDPATLVGTQRVARGGAWSMRAGDCRAAARSHYLPVFGTFFLGVRVVVDDAAPVQER